MFVFIVSRTGGNVKRYCIKKRKRIKGLKRWGGKVKRTLKTLDKSGENQVNLNCYDTALSA